MKIALLGYGKMGKMVENSALQRGHEITHCIHTLRPLTHTTFSTQKPDVAIDFSSGNAAPKLIRDCINQSVPVVSGTTSMSDQLQDLIRYCEDNKGAFIYASNFSVGVQLFFKLNKYLARLMESLPEYEVSMTEVHHIHKKDAPSGTAITLAEDIIQELPQKNRWVNYPSKKREEMTIVSKRINEVPGTHMIEYASAVDCIEIKHTAKNRTGFALGAILAAEWILGKTGFFTMDDVLRFP